MITKFKIMKDQWVMLSKMISIVSSAFEGKLDKGGKPYIFHCLRVMNGVDQTDPEKMQIAAGHDLIEDRKDIWSAEKLRAEGFTERVVCGILRLSHDDGSPYMDYIEVNSYDPDFNDVKRSDLRDNSDITRLKGLREKDFERLKKYNQAYDLLSHRHQKIS